MLRIVYRGAVSKRLPAYNEVGIRSHPIIKFCTTYRMSNPREATLVTGMIGKIAVRIRDDVAGNSCPHCL